MSGLLFPKCGALTLREERRAKRKAVESNERKVEDAVRKRDGVKCRIPNCREDGECAHIEPKKMGGDHGERTNTANCFRCCYTHHRALRGSIHSGDLEVIPLTKAGADGPMAYHWKLTGMTISETWTR